MSLKKYYEKRNFDSTPEPRGELRSVSARQRFVIQRHDASRLHYDLRLEINGSLKSWAIPKGPSMNPKDKRLAVETEDHPLDYLTFHGTIPKGNYGAGKMIIWDTGTFAVDATETDQELSEQWVNGNIKLIFFGKKIKGRFALVRTSSKNRQEQWLLIKKGDKYAISTFYDAETLVPVSEIKAKKNSSRIKPGIIIQPMLASTTENIFNDPNFIYELKWDGYRLIAHISEDKVLLQSRNGINYNSKFAPLYEELCSVNHEVILDGEVVMVDEEGVSQFGELQNYPESKGELRYYVFDMIYLNGHSMLDLKLVERKSLIPQVIGELSITRYCDHIEGMGTALYEKALEVGMEGVMAKEQDSNYSVGFRTEKWLKVKGVQSTDAIICGYTEGKDGAGTLGSLVLGQIIDDELIYIGNCGTGFRVEERKDLQAFLSQYEIQETPFHKKINIKGRKPRWTQPIIECEVVFSQRTKNNLLRNPVLKRIKSEIPKKNDKIETTTGSVKKTFTSKEVISIDGLKVPISNLDKVYWPQSAYSKYNLIDYYLSISEFILPHLQDRPQNLHRHPNGILQQGFYQKDNEYLPEWFETLSVYSKSSEKEINYLLCQNTASLIYMANLGCIEINPWSSRKSSLENPDYGIIDLDPPKEMVFKNVVTVAKEFYRVLQELKVQSFCKLSGSKGLHIYIPMAQKYNYEEVRNFIKLLCYIIEGRLSKLTTLERTINKRAGKIYLDYLQNRRGHSIASAHSVRPLEYAPVSAPIHWEELNDKVTSRKFSMKDYQKRLEKEGDLFSDIYAIDFDMSSVLSEMELLH